MAHYSAYYHKYRPDVLWNNCFVFFNRFDVQKNNPGTDSLTFKTFFLKNFQIWTEQTWNKKDLPLFFIGNKYSKVEMEEAWLRLIIYSFELSGTPGTLLLGLWCEMKRRRLSAESCSYTLTTLFHSMDLITTSVQLIGLWRLRNARKLASWGNYDKYSTLSSKNKGNFFPHLSR